MFLSGSLVIFIMRCSRISSFNYLGQSNKLDVFFENLTENQERKETQAKVRFYDDDDDDDDHDDDDEDDDDDDDE